MLWFCGSQIITIAHIHTLLHLLVYVDIFLSLQGPQGHPGELGPRGPIGPPVRETFLHLLFSEPCYPIMPCLPSS